MYSFMHGQDYTKVAHGAMQILINSGHRISVLWVCLALVGDRFLPVVRIVAASACIAWSLQVTQ